ncbi:DUF3558 domain-containing protein [Streptomyces sp. NPDC006984]|uniref:DUF3558 domain-containing protein n=1 Tax=Streptomyces sp. NPDC006984 TaxID=3155463 RepID=UPI0033C5864E
MLRKVYLPGVAALLVAAVVAGTAGCTSDGGPDGSATDAKAAGGALPAAQPGRYRTLLEPCGAVDRGILRDMLPGVVTLPEEQQRQALRGTAQVTYDTDRRAACSWKGNSPGGTHQLRVDFERVVSYDPAVSDEARAQEVFARRQAAASVPLTADAGGRTDAPGDAGPSATPAPSGSGPALGTRAGPAAITGPGSGSLPAGSGTGPSGQPGGPAGEPSPSGSAAALQPRVLTGLGDAAFLDDVLDPAGSAAQRRTVSVVFRTSNVIVTLVYAQRPAAPAAVPDSKELQEKTQAMASRLAEQFDD